MSVPKDSKPFAGEVDAEPRNIAANTTEYAPEV
jgi:hypothetical protein